MTMTIDKLAQEAAGNWQDFDSFAWHDQPEDADNWVIVYTNNRDSGLMDQSNAHAIAEMMKPYLGTDAIAEHHGHWACGWVDGYAIRVYDTEGGITAAFRTWCEIREALEHYCLLDESDYSQREYDASLENLRESLTSDLRDADLPDDWEKDAFSYLWDVDGFQEIDDSGYWPKDGMLLECFIALGWLPGDEDEEPRHPDN